MKEELKKLNQKLDNHLIGVGKEITEIKVDVRWLKKFFWLITTPSITGLIAAIIALITK